MYKIGAMQLLGEMRIISEVVSYALNHTPIIHKTLCIPCQMIIKMIHQSNTETQDHHLNSDIFLRVSLFFIVLLHTGKPFLHNYSSFQVKRRICDP